MDTRRDALTAAVREGRRRDALREAHALRNSAGMLRLAALHGQCEAMEQAAARPATAPGAPQIDMPDLPDILTRLLPLLEAGVARVRAVTSPDGVSDTKGTGGTTGSRDARDARDANGATDIAMPGTVPAKETHR